MLDRWAGSGLLSVADQRRAGEPMPAERVSMRRIREILRLKHECGASDRAIGRSLGIARSTVALTLDRVAAAGLAWPLSATLSDRVLEALLYGLSRFAAVVG